MLEAGGLIEARGKTKESFRGRFRYTWRAIAVLETKTYFSDRGKKGKKRP